jgi:S-adenosylmethionine-diacylglycerol 3-amino-3-carboxypropyl transferase
MVASGGCTAAALAGDPRTAAIHLVDQNPAQVALARLKLHLLATQSGERRLSVLGHTWMTAAERSDALQSALARLDLPCHSLGPYDLVACAGPDHAGRYERLFAALRNALGAWSTAIEELLDLTDPVEQTRRAAPRTDFGTALDEAFGHVMALPNLVALFGEEATRNCREPFASHFAHRLRVVLATQPARGNPFLTQMLLGRFARGSEHAWLRIPTLAAPPQVAWTVGSMVDALRLRRSDTEFVHLSNILDWLSPDEAGHTLDLARTALVKGGWVLVRQLNSTLDIPALGKGFDWHVDEGAALLASDRSFFYRAIHLGRRL